jgi:molybdenum cofactor biosynthesis enzyme MoaA
MHTVKQVNLSSLRPVASIVPGSLSRTVAEVLDNGTVNFHFTRQCNFACNFCFHTAKTDAIFAESELLRVLDLIRGAGVAKVNFAGGEPFKFPKQLGSMVKHAKSIGMYTSVR